jgi:hypothetical protein
VPEFLLDVPLRPADATLRGRKSFA